MIAYYVYNLLSYCQIYVSRRQGWRPEGVVLYNKLYKRVITSRKMHNDEFDQAFSLYVDTLDSLDESKKKKSAKLNVPVAFNDLA